MNSTGRIIAFCVFTSEEIEIVSTLHRISEAHKTDGFMNDKPLQQRRLQAARSAASTFYDQAARTELEQSTPTMTTKITTDVRIRPLWITAPDLNIGLFR
ncbi:unnamed protein product [Soboliphyme baturini]|uniref:Kinesin motor domain-containing protein n=1 Tax=Soboliphyme baturini TaxID=241478 RepID=A0A183J7I9_9BILA|nr:unnamed protein product [Soboliphyme baturini]